MADTSDVAFESEIAISVVISTRNRARWLPDCLRSLSVQDCVAPFEVVVVDNGSTDETPDVLAEWCTKDRRFRAAREERVGLSVGKNRGILLSRGPTILFTDDDVVVDPSWISAYHGFLNRRGGESVLAGGRIAPMPHDLGGWPPWFEDDALRDLALLDYASERPLARGEYVWGANMAVPRILFERYGLWDEAVGVQGDKRNTFEDAEYQDRIRDRGVAVWFCPTAAIRHRVERATITPRRVTANAFNRGRNEFWQKNALDAGEDPRSWPRRNVVGGLTDLAKSLVGWVSRTIEFRISSTTSAFAGIRRAAYTSGWALESMRGGRGLSFQVIGRLALLTRGSVLRVTPDRP